MRSAGEIGGWSVMVELLLALGGSLSLSVVVECLSSCHVDACRVMSDGAFEGGSMEIDPKHPPVLTGAVHTCSAA